MRLKPKFNRLDWTRILFAVVVTLAALCVRLPAEPAKDLALAIDRAITAEDPKVLKDAVAETKEKRAALFLTTAAIESLRKSEKKLTPEQKGWLSHAIVELYKPDKLKEQQKRFSELDEKEQMKFLGTAIKILDEALQSPRPFSEVIIERCRWWPFCW